MEICEGGELFSLIDRKGIILNKVICQKLKQKTILNK